MKIAFYLPRIYNNPGGGAKIVLEYANFLATKGYFVDIYYQYKITIKDLIHPRCTYRKYRDFLVGRLRDELARKRD